MFIVQEIQTVNGTTALLPAEVYETQLQAESAFHSKLGYAAQSEVDIHAVIIYDEYGRMQRTEVYEHEDNI